MCYWCGTTFQPEVRQRRPVCQRCYRLLTGAGIKDEEIFGEAERDGDAGGEKATDHD